jgi:hypothetical protein
MARLQEDPSCTARKIGAALSAITTMRRWDGDSRRSFVTERGKSDAVDSLDTP